MAAHDSEPKRRTKRTKPLSGGFLTNPIYIQIIWPLLLWLTRQRDSATDQPTRMSINGGIILHSAIFLEGFLEDILCTFIPNYSDGMGGKTAALTDIEKTSSLEGYKSLFRGFGLRLGDFLNGREQEDLDFIFRYRNLLAHGQRDSYIIFHGEDFVPTGITGSVYEDIEKFLVKRKVLTKSRSIQPNHSGLFSDPVADWVFERARVVITKMVKALEQQLPDYQMLQRMNVLRFSQIMRTVEKRAREI